jgi:glycosyltransferase involved in cell wall biosynthesis
LNILLVADVSISNVIGGAERVLYEQATRLVSRGHNVAIITRKLPNQDKDYEVIDGVNEYRYDCNLKHPLTFLYTTWKNSKKLFKTLHQKINFDCINFHQPLSAIGVIHSAVSEHTPKIYTCHSLALEEFLSRNDNTHPFITRVAKLLQSQVYKKIEKNVLKKSNQVLVLSKFTKDKISNIYKILPEKIKIIPGGVDISKFKPAVDKDNIRQQLNIPQDKVVLFTVRNLVQRMGLENLIIAFNEFEKEAADIQLVIGGKGPLEDELIALARSFGIEKKVHFTGFISEEQLPLYYQMADLFVLPSKELEGFGLVTLEAMASGLPVIGTPVGGTKEILGKFNTEFLFEDTKPDSIAKLVLKKYLIIRNNPQRWKQISKQCRKFVEKNYSWKQNIDVVEQLIQGN